MKISRGQLRTIIREELSEASAKDPSGPSDDDETRDGRDLLLHDLGSMLNSHIASSSGMTEDIEHVLGELGANDEQIRRFMDAVDRLEAAYSEASSSPAEHNQNDWDKAEPKAVAVLKELGIEESLGDFNVYFPVEQWEEGLRDEDEDDGHDTGEDESELERDANVDRLSEIATGQGYNCEIPYEWGYNESGEEIESGAVRFDAAITDDYDGWIVGLDQNGNVILHTTDDDIDMSLDELERLLKNSDLDAAVELSTTEINALLGRDDDDDDEIYGKKDQGIDDEDDEDD